MSESKRGRPPLWAVLLTDFLIACLVCGLLAVYFVFLPRTVVGEMLPVEGDPTYFSLPVEGENIEKRLEDLVLSGKKGQANREILSSFWDDEKQLILTRNTLGEGKEKITWYTADVYVTSIKVIMTHVSTDEENTVINKSVLSQANECDALLAITGDTFSMSKDGVIVRNGLLYRNDVRTFNDICVLTLDGTMRIFERRNLYSITDIKQARAWQAFTFGPSLLDGKGEPKNSFNIAASHLSDLSNEHPRTAIGMVEPGHFVFTLVDGRAEGYSKGATFPELAQIMKDEGCTVAYNLDGGRSSVMTYDGSVVNKPYKNGRGISDIIYIPKGSVTNDVLQSKGDADE